MLRTSSPGPTRDTIYLTSSAPQMPLSWQHRDWTAPWLDLRWGARARQVWSSAPLVGIF
jgi:hypothetical protein